VKLPWNTILLHGPVIVEAARKLYAAARKATMEAEPREHAPGEVDPLRGAVVTLERRQEEQAALVADLAGQLQDMARGLDVLRARVRLALISAWFGVALAMLSIALLLWRTR
jgi:hypothetical protein